MEKTCLSCNLPKPLTEFHTDRSRKDLLNVYCKPCMRAKVKEYRTHELRHKSPEGMRYCGVCKETKPETEFYAAKNNVGGLSKRCKACSRETLKIWKEKNPEKHRENWKRWGAANIQKKRDIALKCNYGLPLGSYDRMLAAQNGRCAICQTDKLSAKTTRLHVDHNHETGVVRGLLCTNCNTGLGQFRHKEALLQAAIKYIQDYPKVPLNADVDSILPMNVEFKRIVP